MLLGHHQRLGLHDVVAILSVVVHLVDEDRETARERRVVKDVAARRVLEVARLASDARQHLQLLVPSRLRRPWLPGLARIEQDGDVIDAAVDHASLAADDVGNGCAPIRGGRRDVRRRIARVVRREAGWRRTGARTSDRVVGPVVKRVDGTGIALGIGRRAEPEAGGAADPGLHLRPGEDRSADRLVGDGELGAAGARVAGDELVRPERHAGDQTHDPSTKCGARNERARNVAAVEAHRQTGRAEAGGQHDLNQRIATRDEVSAVGKRLDDDRARAGRGCRSGNRGGHQHQRGENQAAGRADAHIDRR